MLPAVSEAPQWLQYIIFAGIGLGGVGALITGYRKGGRGKDPHGEAVVLSATIADAKVAKALIEAIQENTDAVRDAGRKHCACLNENTDALAANTDAGLNMLRFLKRREGE